MAEAALPINPTGSMLDFDFSLWKEEVQQLAQTKHITEYLQLDALEYNKETDPFFALKKPKLQRTTTQAPTTGSATRSASQQQAQHDLASLAQLQANIAIYQIDLQDYQITEQKLDTLQKAIRQTLPSDVAKAISKHKTPASAYHAVLQFKSQHKTRITQHLQTQWHNMFNQYSGYDEIEWLDQLESLYLRLKDIQPAFVIEAGQILLKHLLITQPTFAELVSDTELSDLNFTSLITRYRERVSC